jgi:hypothetical protein
MELRKHPALSSHSIPTWPPIWASTEGAWDGSVIKGEVGILTKCTGTAVGNICFLFIEHDGKTYVGALVVDNDESCRRLLALFEQHIGRPIAEIGGVDLDCL